MELEKARVELQNARRQCELVKSLLADATTEKEIMYEVCRLPPRRLSVFNVGLFRRSTRSWTACIMMPTSQRMKRGQPCLRIYDGLKNPETRSPRRTRMCQVI